jgi:hypothetical protein
VPPKRSFLDRLLLQSVGGQLLAMLLLALAITQGLGLFLLTDERNRTVGAALGLEAAGVVNDVRAMVTCGYGSIYMEPGDRAFATVKPVSLEYGFDKRNAFDPPALKTMLREKLTRFPHVQTQFGCEVMGFPQDETDVTAEVRSAGAVRYLRAR